MKSSKNWFSDIGLGIQEKDIEQKNTERGTEKIKQ